MKKLFISFLVIGLSLNATAASLEVVDVKRNIPLAETEPVYKDFYIKVASRSDLKKNQVVKATRKIIVKDASLKPMGDFVTTVGLLKIVQVSDSIAVAREFKLIPRADEAMIEQIGIMVGDEIDTSDSFTDTGKPAEKRWPNASSDVVPTGTAVEMTAPAATAETPAVAPAAAE